MPNVPYGPDARQTLDLYVPAVATAAPALLFIHGGSWKSGDKSLFSFVGQAFARAGYLTAVMNYRLAPANPYPAFVQDAAGALKFLYDRASAFGGQGNNLFVMGHSAGAYNAVEAVVGERWLREAGVPVSAVRGVIGLAGPYATDFRGYPLLLDVFPVGASPVDILPALHVRPDAPPHLLLRGERDDVISAQEAQVMAQALTGAGASAQVREIPGLDHYTIVTALGETDAQPGSTRRLILDFLEARRLR